MKIMLLYYSGAGNTTFIAQSIERTLLRKNYSVQSCRITEKSIAAPCNDFDLLLLGFPVYFRDAPKLVYTALEKLSGNGRPIMVFVTKGLYSGNVLQTIYRTAVEKQFVPIGFLDILMPGTDVLTYFVKAGSFAEKVCTNIRSRNITGKIDTFVSKIEKTIQKNKPVKKPRTKWYTFFDTVIVKKLELKIDNAHKNWIKQFTVNKSVCIHCMKCVSGCPRGNITGTDGILFGSQCDTCLYCISNCPTHAINISHKTAGKVKYSQEKIQQLFEMPLLK